MRRTLKVLAIPDLHSPFIHKDAVLFLDAVNKKQKPDVVVCLGDEVDLHSISRHPADPDGDAPGHELKRAIRGLKPIYDMFPDCKVCLGNHSLRIHRRAFEYQIPAAAIRTHRELFDAPDGWEYADEWKVDGVVYIHGIGYSGQQGALKAARSYMAPTVIGHLHGDGGILYESNHAELIWGMNCGWLGDRKSYAMAYGKHSAKRGILGCGIINRGVPTFIPMMLNRSGRWTGAL